MISENYLYDLKSLLNEMSAISLPEMESVELLSRYDKKYVFPKDQLNNIIKKIFDDYKVLDISGIRVHRYNNLYFDTCDYYLFHEHHNKRGNRLKVRFRKYADSGITFFEVKKKNNKGRTDKFRISCDDIQNEIDENGKELLRSLSPSLNVASLIPIQKNDFFRITLVNKKIIERATIDIDLSFNTEGKSISLDGLVVVEVKREERSGISPICRVLKEEKIYTTSVSKYTLGEALLKDGIKKNNFKKQLHKLNKIEHAHDPE